MTENGQTNDINIFCLAYITSLGKKLENIKFKKYGFICFHFYFHYYFYGRFGKNFICLNFKVPIKKRKLGVGLCVYL